MPQLDRLLSVMVSNRAEALRLVENELASLVKDGTAVPLTKQPLGASHLLGLLREIAPPDAMRRLDEGAPAEFQYQSGDGVFNASATNEGGRWTAAITVGVTGGGQAPTPAFTSAVGRPAPAPASSRVPPPPVASSNGVYVGEDTTARAAIDSLLRQLVEQSGSDLHLRCGEPPILRRHGEMVRLGEQAPIDDGTLSRMLHVIMPE